MLTLDMQVDGTFQKKVKESEVYILFPPYNEKQSQEQKAKPEGY